MSILNPRTWSLPWRKAAETSGRSAIGSAQHQNEMGPWSAVFQQFVARQINPHLFEALRESQPIIDGGINTLVTLDGIVRVEGTNAAVVAAVNDWMTTVRVNDAETGLQAFYASLGNEHYEQGFGVGEWTASKDRKGIERLRVADSKGVLFLRDNDVLRTFYRAPSSQGSGPGGLETVESLLRRTPQLTVQGVLEKDYSEIDARRMIYIALNPEADNPYGTSILRSLEFTTQTMLRVQNALGRAWTRWGDPPIHLGYKTKNGRITETELNRRKTALQTELATALQSKETGNSVDFVTATGMMDEIVLNAIGAASVALDPTAVLKHLTEQICAKFSLPPWLLGVDGTVGAGQAERQAEMVMQASRTRWERRKPGLEALVATHLRLKGVTWKPGDWSLEQELPSLQNIMAEAQAAFLHAQARQVGGDGGDDAPRGIDNNLRSAGSPRGKRGPHVHAKGTGVVRKEPWADDEENLDRIEKGAVRRALVRWWTLGEQTATALGFDFKTNEFIAPADALENWVFPRGSLEKLLALGSRFTAENSGEDAPVLSAAWDAWVRGTLSAADEGLTDRLTPDYEAFVRAAMNQRLSSQVYTTSTRAYMEKFVNEFSTGKYDGMSPTTVAQLMTRKFGAGEYDWQRLITNEMAVANAAAKKAVYGANGLEKYHWKAGPGACGFCLDMEASGPYILNSANAPTPGADSHPGCRCGVSPVFIDDDPA